MKKRILLIGSGPIIIGQAAEFDYSGTQACISLREEGMEIVLVNPNPATIMTDKDIADKVYMEPLTVPFLKWIISREKPDYILPTFGGQVALNIAVELHNRGVLKKYNVQVIGCSIETIKIAENREKFRNLLTTKLKLNVAKSVVINSVKEGIECLKEFSFPIMIRPSYTLGGFGSFLTKNLREFKKQLANALEMSPIHQCLVEESLLGMSEIEYEIMRDQNGTAIAVCNMENVEPVGVHTGDSIVVAPSLTINNREYQLMREISLQIVDELKICGGCNVQLAYDKKHEKVYIIEINPRVSRSSALASKASSYPIARIAAKLAIGKLLSEITISPYNNTSAALEPSLDYVVCKIPTFPFTKFSSNEQMIFTQMQATGETMAIGRIFEEAFLKGMLSTGENETYLWHKKYMDMSVKTLLHKLKILTSHWIYQVYYAIKAGISTKKIALLTKIDIYFLQKIQNIWNLEQKITANAFDKKWLQTAKMHGFSDRVVATLWQTTENNVYQFRQQSDCLPIFNLVDACAGEFTSKNNYFYSHYQPGKHLLPSITKKQKILIIGSGPIKISQGVEFDYATTKAIFALKELGYYTIVLNNNPETLSTDFTISDKLYFEPITLEHVVSIIDFEKPSGVILQFGGQTAINLIKNLDNSKINILGTSSKVINICEDRKEFAKQCNKIGILTTTGYLAKTKKDVYKCIKMLDFPCIFRPSYVIGGQKMKIMNSNKDVEKYLLANNNIDLWIDKYINGKEVEVDAVSNGDEVIVSGIMEHIEHAGVHSGDSTLVYPSQTITKTQKAAIILMVKKFCQKTNIIGIINFQIIICASGIYLLEANPRSSRTVPFISKSMGKNFIKMAIKMILNIKSDEIENKPLFPSKIFIKSPVFSFNKMLGLTKGILGPEMQSTGEAIGIDISFSRAFYKAMLASGFDIIKHHAIILSIPVNNLDTTKKLLPYMESFNHLNYSIYATSGTYKWLLDNGYQKDYLHEIAKLQDKNKSHSKIFHLIENKELSFIINIPHNQSQQTDGSHFDAIMRYALAHNCLMISNLQLIERVCAFCKKRKFFIGNL